MDVFKIAISNHVYEDMAAIGDFIASKYTGEAAIKYLNNLYEDISTLTYMAKTISRSEWKTIKNIHPEGKRLLSRNKHWNIVFHIENSYVIVDRILPSSIII